MFEPQNEAGVAYTLVCKKKMTPVAKKMSPVAKKMTPVAKKWHPLQKKWHPLELKNNLVYFCLNNIKFKM